MSYCDTYQFEYRSVNDPHGVEQSSTGSVTIAAYLRRKPAFDGNFTFKDMSSDSGKWRVEPGCGAVRSAGKSWFVPIGEVKLIVLPAPVFHNISCSTFSFKLQGDEESQAGSLPAR